MDLSFPCWAPRIRGGVAPMATRRREMRYVNHPTDRRKRSRTGRCAIATGSPPRLIWRGHDQPAVTSSIARRRSKTTMPGARLTLRMAILSPKRPRPPGCQRAGENALFPHRPGKGDAGHKYGIAEFVYEDWRLALYFVNHVCEPAR